MQVIRTGAVPVRLVGSAKTKAEQLEYSIFEAPKHGTLSEITTREGVRGATVVYRPNPGSTALIDGFRFRARIPGGKYSAPGRVKIGIIEPRPLLEMAASLDFGSVPLRTKVIRDLRISNRGTGPFAGTVRVPPPFSVPGGALLLEIPAGSDLVIPVTYEPTTVESARYEWNIQPSSPKGKVKLIGEPFSSFAVEASSFNLELKRDWSRQAKVGVVNGGKQPVSIVIDSPERLQADRNTLELASGERVELTFSLASDDVAEFEGRVSFVSAEHTEEITLRAPTTPARVEIVAPETKLLFEGEFGSQIKGRVAVRNSGGMTAFISAAVSPPFSVAEGNGGVELAPGKTAEYNLTLKPDRLGMIEEKLKIDGGQSLLYVDLQGQVTLPPGLSPPATDYPSAEEIARWEEEAIENRNRVQREGGLGSVETERTLIPTIPPVRVIRVTQLNKRSAVLEWDHPVNHFWDYVLETQIHRIDEETGYLERVWVEVGEDFATVTTTENGGRAEVKGLEPGGKYLFRLFTEGAKGTFSSPGTPYLIVTEPKRSLFGWVSMPLIALICALLAALLHWRNRRKHLREMWA